MLFIFLCLVTPDIYWLNAHEFMFPYFLLGFYYAKRKHNWLNKSIVGWSTFIMWIVLLCFFSSDMYIYTTGITVLGKESAMRQIWIDIYRYVIGATGLIMFVFITRWLYSAWSERLIGTFGTIIRSIESIGRNSIVYYILSTYLFAWVLPALTRNFSLNYFVAVIETVLMILVCSFLGALAKPKLLSKLFLGR